MVPDTVQALKYGLTVPSTKVNGVLTKRTAKGNSGMQTATFMKDCGKTTRQTVMEFTFMSMEQSTRVTGVTTSRTALVLNHGQMVRNTKAAIKKA